MKKICVVSGTRAEYGLLRWVMEGIRQSSELELQLLVTGMHLSSEFGMTVNVIEDDGFTVDRKIEMLLSSDTAVGVTKSMGLGMIGFADALAELKPDLLMLLGDRYEIFAVAASAMIARFQLRICMVVRLVRLMKQFVIALLDVTSAFYGCREYRRRVIQLGES